MVSRFCLYFWMYVCFWVFTEEELKRNRQDRTFGLCMGRTVGHTLFNFVCLKKISISWRIKTKFLLSNSILDYFTFQWSQNFEIKQFEKEKSLISWTFGMFMWLWTQNSSEVLGPGESLCTCEWIQCGGAGITWTPQSSWSVTWPTHLHSCDEFIIQRIIKMLYVWGVQRWKKNYCKRITTAALITQYRNTLLEVEVLHSKLRKQTTVVLSPKCT